MVEKESSLEKDIEDTRAVMTGKIGDLVKFFIDNLFLGGSSGEH